MCFRAGGNPDCFAVIGFFDPHGLYSRFLANNALLKTQNAPEFLTKNRGSLSNSGPVVGYSFTNLSTEPAIRTSYTAGLRLLRSLWVVESARPLYTFWPNKL